MARAVSVVIPARDAERDDRRSARGARAPGPAARGGDRGRRRLARRDRGGRRAPRSARSSGSSSRGTRAARGTAAGRRRRARRWSSSTPTRSRQRAGRQGCSGRWTSSRARWSRAPGRSPPARAGAGSRTCSSRRPTCRTASRGERPTLSSFCLAVPRDVPLRWHESYGGEDGLFSVDALAAGLRLVFDPRFPACTTTGARPSTTSVASSGASSTASLAAAGLLREPVYRRLSPRFPLHYFALLRLPVIYGRIRSDARLRSRFLRLLPWLVVGEWLLGVSALRYVVRAPRRRVSPAAGASSERQADPRHRRAPLGHDLGGEDARARARGGLHPRAVQPAHRRTVSARRGSTATSRS